jgi:2-oxoglutarate ferredoxin oxidoreductase subunit gamma
MKKEQLRFTGSGGQGVIMATIIMAEAAFLDGKKVVQSQSYGPEARGGLCKAETIVDEKQINFTKIELPTLLLSLTQESFDKFRKKLAPAAVVIVDEEIEVPDIIYRKHEVLKLPILRSAVETIGVKMSANIISCGAVNEALGLASEKSLEEAVLNHVPKGTEDTNRKAMQLGAQLVREAREAAKAK